MGVSPRMEISPCELQLGLSSEMHPTCLADPMSLMEHTSCHLTRTTIHSIKYAKASLIFKQHLYWLLPLQLRVDVNHTATSQAEVRPYISGTPMNPPSSVNLPFPVMVTPKEKYEYFMPRESFNLGGMLSNPLMLAMIACGILVVATPYIMVCCPIFRFFAVYPRIWTEQFGSRDSRRI